MPATSQQSAPAISCRGLWQVFGDAAPAALTAARGDSAARAAQLQKAGLIPAVRDATFDVAQGEIFVIMGLSGSGKSTLIRCLARLMDPTAGQVLIDGEDILAASGRRLIDLRRDKLGMVFQHFGLFPHMTVLDNVAFPLRTKGVDRATRQARAREVIALVGLDGRETAYPRELSGGQRQRVGIARSLAVDPDIWFLDEPFSALDPLIRRQLQDEFLSLQARLNKTIVFITHDITEALRLADRIAIMRDGEIVQIGAPADIVLHPVDDYVRAFSRDVAKGRHARLGSVMGPALGEGPDTGAPRLTQGMTLDAALAACLSQWRPVPVWEGDRIVGSVHPRDLAAALQTDET